MASVQDREAERRSGVWPGHGLPIAASHDSPSPSAKKPAGETGTFTESGPPVAHKLHHHGQFVQHPTFAQGEGLTFSESDHPFRNNRLGGIQNFDHRRLPAGEQRNPGALGTGARRPDSPAGCAGAELATIGLRVWVDRLL